MKSGFTLIEILVAIALTGMLAVLLMGTFFQINNSTQLVTDTADMQMRASVLFHQLEKDLRGAYIPSSVLAALHSSEQEKEQEKTEKDEKQEQKKVEPKEGAKKEKELIGQVFVSKNGAGGALDQITFITDNPLAVYWGEKVGKPHQRRVRVMYQVKEEVEEGRPVAYRLVRYESAEISKAPDDTGTGLEVANDIRDISLTYRARVKEESKEENNKEAEKKQEKIEESDTWNTDEQVASKKEGDGIHLPNIVLVDLELWTEDREYSETFSYAIPLEIESAVIPAAIQRRRPTQKKDEKKEEKEGAKKDEKEGQEKTKMPNLKEKLQGKMLKRVNS